MYHLHASGSDRLHLARCRRPRLHGDEARRSAQISKRKNAALRYNPFFWPTLNTRTFLARSSHVPTCGESKGVEGSRREAPVDSKERRRPVRVRVPAEEQELLGA